MNKEKRAARKKAYYEANREQILAKSKAYHKANRERSLAQRKTYREANKEKILAQKLAYREANRDELRKKAIAYYQENREAITSKTTKRVRARRQSDIVFRLRKQLRSRVYCAIKGNFKSGSAVRDLGCSIEYLKAYLEGQFEPGMSWDNWGRHGWHIDHIHPLASFDLTDPEQFKQAVHYTNLQPLWAKDNLEKGTK